MKRSSSSTHKRTNRAIAVFIVFMTAFAPSLSIAATASVDFSFSGHTTPAATVVTPSNPTTTATTSSPVYKTVQTTTELDTTRLTFQTLETAPVPTATETTQGASSTQSAPVAAAAPKIGIGVDAVMSDRLKVYAIPISYSINRTLAVQATLPIVTATIDKTTGGTSTDTGVGDVSLTVKHRIGSERGLAALFTLFSAKFASGDADKGLGTGTYDISLTEKVIKRFGEYRCTIMGGVTQPLNTPTILGSKVEYGTTISYMAAVEHTIGLPELWFGVKAAGMHAFETRIDGLSQGNALTTLDIAPEFSYFFKRNASVNLGVIVPVITEYSLAGGKNDRDIAVNFGVSMLF
jgi:hypothetical protein